MPHALLVEVDGCLKLREPHSSEQCAMQCVSPVEASIIGVVRLFPHPLMGHEVVGLAHTTPPNPRE